MATVTPLPSATSRIWVNCELAVPVMVGQVDAWQLAMTFHSRGS